MKALLAAVNAKYIHSNLGVYCLYAYSRKKGISSQELTYREYTINQNMDEILGDIYEQKPDILGFSCYIWNIEMVEKIGVEIHKLLPDCMIWYGGPETTYHGEKILEEKPWLKGIFCGEGEESFYEMLQLYKEQGLEGDYSQIAGIYVRHNGQIQKTRPRKRMSMDEVVFPYDDSRKLKNRIVYYETSRGCPYGCSYCLSSVEKKVCFRSMELVQKELQFFLDNKVPQVKFVDRTFNCNPRHTMEIWKYIYEHDNGITNFHFELSADILTQEEIDYVGKFRPGLAQFEIGVQSTNPQTIEAINRKMDLDKLRSNVAQIHQKRNIHQHLDLIAGLPYEDFDSFANSFNQVYAMEPDQLQLGFLKLLKGSPMEEQAKQYGIVCQDIPPYEVLFTNWLSYDDVCRLKIVEEMVERYYNSMQFESAIPYLVKQFDTPFAFFDCLGHFYKENQYLGVQQSRIQNYEILYEFAGKQGIDQEILREFLLFDLYARDNLKKEPEFLGNRQLSAQEKEWLRTHYQDENFIERYLPGYREYSWKQIIRMTHVEWFHYNIPMWIEKGILKKEDSIVLFDYSRRNPLDRQAHYEIL